MSEAAYVATADELVKRITALIPKHPELLTMADPWELFTVPGFECRDIGPTLFQAGWALRKAQQDYRD